MSPELLTATSAAIGAGLVQLAAELVVKPLRNRKAMEDVATSAALKAIAHHQEQCPGYQLVGPVADINGG